MSSILPAGQAHALVEGLYVWPDGQGGATVIVGVTVEVDVRVIEVVMVSKAVSSAAVSAGKDQIVQLVL